MPEACEVPRATFLDSYRSSGAYADCYVTEIAKSVSQARYVEAFYTTGLFKVERLLLRLASRPSTDDEARKLACGEIDSFAAWHVERRSDEELLLASGRTRSWLKAVPASSHKGSITLLFFGSAVVPAMNARTGQETLGMGFRSLLGFHRLYSRALLLAARSRLESRAARPGAP